MSKESAAHSLKVMTATGNTEWGTPQMWFDYLDLEFGFTFDPCSTHENAKCKKHYTKEDNGLEKSWNGEVVFMNPPYGREMPKWMHKAWSEAKWSNALVVCLVRAAVDTQWWHQYATRASEVRFPKGRLTFEGADTPAPFPVAIVIFRPSPSHEPLYPR